MFTGLVETMGSVRAFKKTGAVYSLSIEAPEIASELSLGQSVSISGACLSVTALHKNIFDADMMPETVGRTWFNENTLRPGVKVNLERSLKIGGRLDGHLVLGHVDGTAVLKELRGNGETHEAFFEAPGGLLRGIVPKGSVALDGVSLTVIDVGDGVFSVGLIPTTLKTCTLGNLKPGMAVNLETDILGKFVERLLSFNNFNLNDFNPVHGNRKGGLSLEELKELGY